MKRNGFTLMELLAVIAIIGVLMAIAIPIGINISRNTNDNTFKKEINTVETAAEIYARNNYENIKNAYGTCDKKNAKSNPNCECEEDSCYYVIDINVKTLIESEDYTGYSSNDECGLYNENEEKCYDCMIIKLKIDVKTKKVEAIADPTKIDSSCESFEITGKPTIKFDIASGNINSENWITTDQLVIEPIVKDSQGNKIDSYKQCISNNGSTCDPTALNTEDKVTLETSEDGSKDGEYIICIAATDSKGNTNNSCSEPYKIDKTAPTCEFTGESTTWTNKTRTIKLNCSDSGSGCIEKSKSYKYNKSIKKTTIEYKFKDKAGNETTCQKNANVYIDNVPPKCGTIENQNDKCTADPVTIKTNCIDDLSGCVQDVYETTYSKTTYNGYQTIRDKAGNTASCSAKVNVDTDGPVIEVENSSISISKCSWSFEFTAYDIGCADLVVDSNNRIKKSQFSAMAATVGSVGQNGPGFKPNGTMHDNYECGDTIDIWMNLKDSLGNVSEMTYLGRGKTKGSSGGGSSSDTSQSKICSIIKQMKRNSEEYLNTSDSSLHTENVELAAKLKNYGVEAGYDVRGYKETGFWYVTNDSEKYNYLLYIIEGKSNNTYYQFYKDLNYYDDHC